MLDCISGLGNKSDISYLKKNPAGSLNSLIHSRALLAAILSQLLCRYHK